MQNNPNNHADSKKGSINLQRYSKVANFFAQANFSAVTRIRKLADIVVWKNSLGYHNIIAYINKTSTLIQGIRQHDEYPVSDTMLRLVAIFDKLDNLFVSQPPIQQSDSSRRDMESDRKHRGNVAFRNWQRHMQREIFPMLESAVADKSCIHINELGQYLCESFGNPTRMAYGTGHELSFIFFLSALYQAEIIVEEDLIASALLLFDRYLKFVRRLQTAYNLSPAGRHGAYSLDDFQFMPFLWGCAQLSYNAPIVPNQMLEADVISQYKRDYMLLGSVGHIADTKTGTFAMHSSQLWCIASLSSWSELYGGLLDMYDHVVLRQFEILRNARFGQLVPFEEAKPGTKLVEAQLGIMSPYRKKQIEDDIEVEEDDNADVVCPRKKEKVKKLKCKLQRNSSPKKGHSGASSGVRSSSLSGICVYLRNITDGDTCPIDHMNEELKSQKKQIADFASLHTGLNTDDAEFKFRTTVVEAVDTPK